MRVPAVGVNAIVDSSLPLKGVAHRTVYVVLGGAGAPVLSQASLIAIGHELGNE